MFRMTIAGQSVSRHSTELMYAGVSRKVQDVTKLYPIDTVLKQLTLEIQAGFKKFLFSCPYSKQIQAF
jgi:hypothetical protein